MILESFWIFSLEISTYIGAMCVCMYAVPIDLWPSWKGLGKRLLVDLNNGKLIKLKIWNSGKELLPVMLFLGLLLLGDLYKWRESLLRIYWAQILSLWFIHWVFIECSYLQGTEETTMTKLGKDYCPYEVYILSWWGDRKSIQKQNMQHASQWSIVVWRAVKPRWGIGNGRARESRKAFLMRWCGRSDARPKKGRECCRQTCRHSNLKAQWDEVQCEREHELGT